MRGRTEREGLLTRVFVIADEDSTTADLGITGTGEARCRPDDFYVAMTGERIALGRALQDFGRQVEAAGCAESVSNADMHRAEFAAAAKLSEQVVTDFRVAMDALFEQAIIDFRR